MAAASFEREDLFHRRQAVIAAGHRTLPAR
jgi:hypothetical protein